MSTTRVEELLERLVEQNDEIVSELQDISMKLDALSSLERNVDAIDTALTPHSSASAISEIVDALREIKEAVEQD